MTDHPPLAIAIVANPRFGVTEPFAGGLERHTDLLGRYLTDRGHRVTVFAGDERSCSEVADRGYRILPLVSEAYRPTPDARADVSMPAEQFMLDHDAYLDFFDRLDAYGFDVLHNNSIHYLPVVTRTGVPTVHTLHTPPTPWLESAHRLVGRRAGGTTPRARTVSVSESNAARWRMAGTSVDEVIVNGIEFDRWSFGGGEGDYVVWSGRLVPEKGPDDAIAAARIAARRILLAGPIHDPTYFDDRIRPLLGADVDYVGHLEVDALAALVGGAEVCVVSPRWDEPFGLVAIEALASGTPIAAYRRGALPSIVNRRSGRLAAPGDIVGLAHAIDEAAGLDRRTCRRDAFARFDAASMAHGYESSYRTVMGSHAAQSVTATAPCRR